MSSEAGRRSATHGAQPPNGRHRGRCTRSGPELMIGRLPQQWLDGLETSRTRSSSPGRLTAGVGGTGRQGFQQDLGRRTLQDGR
jgi:hypothetical protein